MPTASRPHRSNAERTATTRAKILDAAVACLLERGYVQTTTTEVAARAAVSRGALLHNFPTRGELVVAAAQRAFDQRAEEVRALAAGLAEETDRADAMIETLFAMSQGPTIDVFFEIIVAGRTDAELGPLVASLSAGFQQTVEAVFAEFFARPTGPLLDQFYEAIPTLFMAIVDGLAAQRIAGSPAVRHLGTVLDLTKFLGRQLLEYQAANIEEDTSCP
jgi:AcrR family transcriptional regulator